MGVETAFSEQTSDQHFPALLDLDVYLSTWARGHETEEMVHEEVLWGGGDVLSGEALVEAEDQDDAFQNEVVVS